MATLTAPAVRPVEQSWGVDGHVDADQFIVVICNAQTLISVDASKLAKQAAQSSAHFHLGRRGKQAGQGSGDAAFTVNHVPSTRHEIVLGGIFARCACDWLSPRQVNGASLRCTQPSLGQPVVHRL